MTTSIQSQTLPIANPAHNLLLVPLSQLRRSSRNVRRTCATAIPELAASIQRVGLLQNLTVTLASNGEHYDVVAGSRRLAALKLLARNRRIAKDEDVPCLLVADVAARTASLTENLHREAMHPADQFAAFAALVAEGRSVEEIAADFAVTPLVVQRRLKLANIAPRLMADFRAGEVTLDQLMALAITDDHDAQEAAFYGAPEWQRTPHALRARLTEQEIDASRHPLARFVGLESYEAAGGFIRRDLFADANEGVYLTDSALLYRLAQSKLDALADQVRREGWAWVESVPTLTSADLHQFQHAPMQPRTPTSREAKRIAALQATMQQLGVAIDEAIAAGDEDRADALHDQGDRAGEQLHAIEHGLMEYSPASRAMAGAIVTVDRNGDAVTHRGLLRAAEAKAMRMLAKARQADGTTDTQHAEQPDSPSRLSEKLVRRLSAHRTAALQTELARNPHVALAALVHRMLTQLDDRYEAEPLPLGVTLRPQDRLGSHAPDVPESAAATAMQVLRASVMQGLPQDSAALFAHLTGMAQDALLRLLAVCVAVTVDTVTPREQDGCAALLAQAVGLDMQAWWSPTDAGYFQHVTKATIVADAQQFAPEHAARLAKLTKADCAKEAERLVAGSGWLPAMLRRPESGQSAAA